MPTPSVNELVSALDQKGVLGPDQLAELRRLAAQSQYASVSSLARVLLDRRWLTVNQINSLNRELLAGRGGPGLPPTTPPDRPPRMSGGYELVERIAGGGFGEVWKARAPGGFFVAVKVTHATLDADAARRELASLEAIKGLRHPYLLGLHASWLQDSRLHVAMELADKTLFDRLAECRAAGAPGLPPEELLRCAGEAAEALDFLHAHKVLHLDVKPANLLLVAGHVKVADFGLARLMEAAGRSLTGNGGTTPYMAPEIFTGGRCSNRCDQYALAVSYAELRLGRRPIDAADGSVAGWMRAHVEDEPDLAGMSEPEKAVVLRALAKDREQRYPGCGKFVAALREALADGAPAARRPVAVPVATPARTPAALPAGPPTKSRGHRGRAARGLAAGVGSLVLAAGLGLGLLGWARGWWRDAPATAPESERESFGGSSAKEEIVNEGPRKPPDGNDPPEPPVWKPDPIVKGRPRPYLFNGKPLTWPPPELLTVLGDEAGHQWDEITAVALSPGGDLIATGARNGWHLWDARTLRERRLVRDGRGPVSSFAFTPDGQKMAVGRRVNHSTFNPNTIDLYDLTDEKAGPQSLKLPGSPFGTDVVQVRFATGGRDLLVLADGGAVWKWDLSAREPEGKEVLPRDQSVPQPMALSADGKKLARAALGGGNRTTVKVRALGPGPADERALPETLASASALALSEDGTRLAVAYGNTPDQPRVDADGVVEVWDVSDAEPRPIRTHTLSKLAAGAVTFFPGGKVLAFATSDHAAWLWDLSAEAPVAVGRHGGTITGFAASRDGGTLFSCGRDRAVRSWKVDFAAWRDNRPRPAVPPSGVISCVAFAPGGGTLAAVRHGDKPFPEPGETSAWSVWDLTSKGVVLERPLDGRFAGVTYTPDGKSLLSWGSRKASKGGQEAFVQAYDAAKGEEGESFSPGQWGFETLEMDGAGKTVILGSLVGPEIVVCGLNPLEKRDRVKSSYSPGLALSPDGTRLATTAEEQAAGVGPAVVIKLWALDDPKKGPAVVSTIPAEKIPGRRLQRLAFLPGGKTLLSVDDGGRVKTWDVAKKSQVSATAKEEGRCEALAVAPDGKLAATVHGERVVLWDVASLKELQSWTFPGPVYALAFDRSGQRLASGNGNGTAYVLDVSSYAAGAGK